MNIAGTDFDLNQKALCIYLSGCDGACKGCHNSELWDFSVGESWESYGKLFRKKLSSSIVEQMFVMGGEPLLQNNTSLQLFLQYLKQYKKPIILWTRLYDIPENIKQYTDYAKIGEYQCDSESYTEPLFGITLASTNQKIIKINY